MTSKWQPIEEAPKDGSEILAWRVDAGVMIVRWTALAHFLTDSEAEALATKANLSDEDMFAEDWFYADFCAGGRLDSDEIPTHWMPLPDAP